MYKCSEEDTINEVLNGAELDKLFSQSMFDRDLLCI